MATFVAVPYQLYALTGSALQVGLLSICDAVPLLAFAAVGGTVADRFDRRKVVLWTDLGLMAVAALLAVNAFAGSPQVWALYVLAACATSLWSLGAPALRAMMPGLVPEHQLAASQALQSIYSQTAAIAGPALGGLLIAAAGIGWAYAIDAATFSASLVAVLLVAPAPPRGEIAREALESLREGWRFLLRQPVILGTFALDTNAMVFGMPQALFPAIAVNGFATALWLGLAMLAIAGLADEISAILRSTILFACTPDHYRGRMQGFELAQVASTPALGNVEAGIVASLTSLRFSVVSGGIASAAGAVAILALLPGLFRYDGSGHGRGLTPTATEP